MRCKVSPVDQPADRRDRGRETLAELAAIELVGAVAGDRAKGRREVGLLEHLAGARPPTSGTEHSRGFVVARESFAFFRGRGSEHVADREAVLGVRDRRCERAIEAETPVVRGEIGQAGDETRDGSDARALIGERGTEALPIERVRRGTRSVVGGDLARSRVIDEREDVPADRRAMRHDDRADRSRGDRGVSGATPVTERGKARGRRQVVAARDECVRGTDGWACGHARLMLGRELEQDPRHAGCDRRDTEAEAERAAWPRDHRGEREREQNESEVRTAPCQETAEQDVTDRAPRERRCAVDDDHERADRGGQDRAPEHPLRRRRRNAAARRVIRESAHRDGVESRGEKARGLAGSAHARSLANGDQSMRTSRMTGSSRSVCSAYFP